MNPDRYYRHSGKFPPAAVLKGLAAGLAASVPLAFVYAYAIVYIPIIGVVSFILTAGFAAIVGLATGALLHAGKVRNQPVAYATALPVGLFALWASWVVWVYALLHRADSDVGLFEIAFSPVGLWKVINLINEKGAWNLKGFTPTGGFLWFLWGLEALLIVGIIVFVAGMMVDNPFCEACDRWCEEHKSIAVRGPTTKEHLTEPLEQGNYAILNQLPAPDAASYTRFDMHQCGQCQATTTLTATGVTVTMKKGKEEQSESVLVRYLLVPPGDLGALQRVLAEGQAAQVQTSGA
jgi:hypothetical protein